MSQIQKYSTREYPSVSVIIITLNEEENIGQLLKSLQRQTIKPYEIIVADANSTDKTRAIARSYNTIIVPGGNSPTQGRNYGAKYAKGDWFLFLDADAIIKPDFIEKSLQYVLSKKKDVVAYNLTPSTQKKIDKILLNSLNIYFNLLKEFWPQGVGVGIFCKRNIFEKIKGFDESIELGEDMDFVRRAGKVGSFGMVPKVRITFSMRRFEEDGRLKMTARTIAAGVYRIFIGEIRNKKVQSKIINYENRKEWLENVETKKKKKELRSKKIKTFLQNKLVNVAKYRLEVIKYKTKIHRYKSEIAKYRRRLSKLRTKKNKRKLK